MGQAECSSTLPEQPVFFVTCCQIQRVIQNLSFCTGIGVLVRTTQSRGHYTVPTLSRTRQRSRLPSPISCPQSLPTTYTLRHKPGCGGTSV
jgi:hypothetical protein